MVMVGTMDKHVDGYRSYSYLDSDGDYRSFELASDVARVPAHDMGLGADAEERVRRILDENIVISLHDHPVRLPARPVEVNDYARSGHPVTGYQGLSRSGLDAVFDNMGIWFSESLSGWKWTETIADIGMRFCDIAHQDFVIRAQSTADIRRAKETGKLALVPGLEGAGPIENELDRIDILYGLGIRQLGIVHSGSNALGCGLAERSDGGLTTFGRRAVRRMNNLGMAVDVSHAGDRTALDTIEASEQPVLITHAGARGVWDSPRMKPDDVIVRCAERGGLIGIEAAPHTTLSAQHPRHGIDSVMDHFRYCVDLVGIEHVTFGPDTFFGDHVGVHRELGRELGVKEIIFANPDIQRVEYVAGMENPGECFPNITRWLVGNGYSDTEIAAVIGGNSLRVLDQIWCA
jgi:membrane dipeptidase